MNSDSCENCRFFIKAKGQISGAGECRERVHVITVPVAAPATVIGGPQMVDLQIRSAFAPMHKTGWCGQHQAKERLAS